MARAISYLYFFLAGETAALTAWLITFGPYSLVDQFSQSGGNPRLGLLPGLAAMAAAALLQAPFTRLQAAGRWGVAVLLAFPGVVLAHLLYTVMVFLAFVVQHHGLPLSRLLDDALWQAGIYGLFSVILAFLLNLSVALLFMLVALWRWRRKQRAAAGAAPHA